MMLYVLHRNSLCLHNCMYSDKWGDCTEQKGSWEEGHVVLRAFSSAVDIHQVQYKVTCMKNCTLVNDVVNVCFVMYARA